VAFSFQNGSGARRRGGMNQMAEINIIPLVDVVLVLLVIFMLTAHVMEFGLEIDVPKVKQVKDSAQELPVVSINRGGELFLNDKPVNIHELGGAFHTRFPRAKSAYVRCDRNIIWGVLMPVISALGEEKIQPLLIAQPDDGKPR
jgi:biopolymer transport protein ExbD